MMVGMLTDVGNVRSLNEDFLGSYKDDHIKIYIVADGMGGHNAGEVASKIAVESIIEYLKNNYDESKPEDSLKTAITDANNRIYNLSKEHENLNGMGTTITACLDCQCYYLVANVGDSSCFIINNSGISKVTKDHSLVQELIDEGTITENQALHHPNKNIITRAVGTNKNLDIDIYKLDRSNIKFILLCTDGLTNEVAKEEIYDIIINNSIFNNSEICSKLVELAKARGGRDNISVIIFGGEHYDDRNDAGR